MISEFEQKLKKIYINHEMREILDYNLLAGGKRLRPMLFIKLFSDLNTKGHYSMEDCMSIAAAIEMIHTYSLIHDDLPGMDNDDLRRGKPTTHIKFSHADAILAGDALLTDAFTILSKLETIEPYKVVKLINLVSQASGSQGMILGQKLDIDNKNQTFKQIERMHALKTGRLIKLPAQICHVLFDNAITQKAIEIFKYLGQWFQINDDIIDQVASTEQLGKPNNSDIKNKKENYITLIGLNESIINANKLKENIIDQTKMIKIEETEQYILDFLLKNKMY
jgi:geranylgeranyl diphosphate synthase type II